MLLNKFEEIDSWKKGRELAKEIYAITKRGPFSSDWALRDQIRKSSISIISNIAEGFERNSKSAFANYLSIAKASSGELRSQLYISLDQGYVSAAEFERLSGMTVDVAKLLGGLIRSLKK